MPLLADRVKESTSTTGTGTLTLLGAYEGYQTFTNAFGNGIAVYYAIAGGDEWEVGIGTTGAGTLTRSSVLASSNGGTLVPFSSGIKDVLLISTPKDINLYSDLLGDRGSVGNEYKICCSVLHGFAINNSIRCASKFKSLFDLRIMMRSQNMSLIK